MKADGRRPRPSYPSTRSMVQARAVCLLSLIVAISACRTAPVVSPQPPGEPARAARDLPGDYLTDHEKDYFQRKISMWAYYASPVFVGGNPANANLPFWDRVDYEWIFFGDFGHSSEAWMKDVFLDAWVALPVTTYKQVIVHGVREWNTARGVRNICFGLIDGVMDCAHEIFDAVKILDGHWKLPFHPGCTYEGGTRFLSYLLNKGLVDPMKPLKPVYYTLWPVGRLVELVARCSNAGFLIGIKVCKWPPMLAEDIVFGGYDLITFRKHRGPFRRKLLPFSFRSGCVFYMYEGDMNYRRGPEIRFTQLPRQWKNENRTEREETSQAKEE